MFPIRGSVVQYYWDGWRYGYFEEFKKGAALIRPIVSRYAGTPRFTRVPMEDVRTIEGEKINAEVCVSVVQPSPDPHPKRVAGDGPKVVLRRARKARVAKAPADKAQAKRVRTPTEPSVLATASSGSVQPTKVTGVLSGAAEANAKRSPQPKSTTKKAAKKKATVKKTAPKAKPQTKSKPTRPEPKAQVKKRKKCQNSPTTSRRTSSVTSTSARSRASNRTS